MSSVMDPPAATTLLQLVLSAHLIATLALVGLIWFVQIVHYPLMAHVGEAGFIEYEQAHVRRTTWVVAPLMLVEVVTAGLLPFLLVPENGRLMAIAGAVIVGAIWWSTATLQVPLHRRLEHGFDALVVRRLVRTNWIRTVGWTARGVIAYALGAS